MSLEQWLMPGENIHYRSSSPMYYGGSSYTFYVTNERILLHAVAGFFFSSKEYVVAERLNDIDSMEYSEGGIFSKQGRLKVSFRHKTIPLIGRPDAVKAAWQTLQQYIRRPQSNSPNEYQTRVVPEQQPLWPPTQAQQVQPLTPPLTSQTSQVTSPPLAALLVGGALGALIGILLIIASTSSSSSSSYNNNVSSMSSSMPLVSTPASSRIMNKAFTLETEMNYPVKFVIPSDYISARVSGGFRVTSGSNIDFYVMTKEQYDYFLSGGISNARSLVHREQERNAKVNERLQAGTYYLVWDNWEADSGAKTIAAEFFVVFD